MASPIYISPRITALWRDTTLKRKLQTRLAFRLLMMCVLGCLTGYLVFDSPYWLAGIWTGLATILIFIQTIRLVDSSERKLTAFLQALRQNDFAVTFAENPTSDDYDLHQAFNQLNEIFKTLRSERESQHRLLGVVVEQTGAPIVCFEETNGEIYLINNAAKQLLGVPFLQKIDSLARIDFELPTILREMHDGERVSYKLAHGGKISFLSVISSHVRFEDRNLKLITLNDVTSELAAREAETWQKLLRVLTHEISNSAIPLSTLSSYIYEMVVTSREQNRDLTDEQRTDIMTSLKTIDQRSRTLKEFVHSFRMVGQVPEPLLERIRVHDLIMESVRLFSKQMEKDSIHCQVIGTEEVVIYADRSLTQQVIINLLKNAIEAMENMKTNKRIEIRVIREGNRYAHIHIRDSGSGIASDELEQIFIPFFSTKKGGSGIGLSISRQIMQKQKGDITVESQPGKGSIFRLSFQC